MKYGIFQKCRQLKPLSDLSFGFYLFQPAVETHEMLYQVMQRHNFLPEAFTTDFQVHWGQHPLRPEFVESTYFLYRATGDPYYLEAINYIII